MVFRFGVNNWGFNVLANKIPKLGEDMNFVNSEKPIQSLPKIPFKGL
ncbi:Uncharacterised protein [Streptococcus pneumoniae]|nr:Uncharacterised protein [Streptococcus pneumoniae]CYK90377.1 Uncharacterised protein [Streptococcus pneumoniae]